MRKLFILLLTGVLAACASGAKTNFVLNPDVALDSYQSFSWVADDPQLSEPPDYSRKNDDRIEEAITAVLTEKGYLFVADRDKADFVVGYSVGIRKNLKLSAAPDYFGANWSHASGYIPPGGDRIPGRELGVPDSFWQGIHKDYGAVIESGRREGTLTVDVFDVDTKNPAWQGSIEKEITQHDRENATESFNDAISKLFEPFPAANDQ